MNSQKVASQAFAQSSTQMMDLKRFEELLQDAKDFDPDKKFMAANDLSNALFNGQLGELDYEIVVKILLAQLNDDSSEVQGNSIRCLSKIINKLQEQQVESVSKTMISKVIQDKGEYRDVYATCLKTLITTVPLNYSKAVTPILLLAVQGMEQKKNTREFDVQEELCDILNNFFKKWGAILVSQSSSVKNLTPILVNNIFKGERNSLRKKSCSCLGSLTLMLPKEEVVKIIKDLLAFLKKPTEANQLQAYLREKQIYVVYALNAISKVVPKKIGAFLKHLITSILNDIQQYISMHDDYDLVIIISEMFESYLSILESLIKGSPDESKEFFPSIVELAAQLLNYDPSGTARFQSAPNMEIEENGDGDEYEYLSDDQDGDDSSWRVRRGALNILETLVKSDSEMIAPIFKKCVSNQGDESSIVYRLGESNENIRFATFTCLTTIVRAIVVSDASHEKHEEDFDYELHSGPSLSRVKSAVQEFNISEIISEIFKTLNNILQKEKKVSQGVQLGAYKLVESITSNLSNQVINDANVWSQALVLVKRTIENKGVQNELKVSAFSSLRKLLKHPLQANSSSSQNSHLLADTQQLLTLLSTGLSQSYYKIVSESFRCLSSLFIMISHSGVNTFLKQLNEQIFPSIMSKLSSSDTDQEVKQACLSAAASLVVNLGQILEPAQQQSILQAITDKIKSETKKIPVLKVLKKWPVESSSKATTKQLQQQQLATLNEAAQQIIQLLAKQDRSLRVASLEALEKLLTIIFQAKATLTQQTRGEFALRAADFLNERDTWVASLYLRVLKLVVVNSPEATANEYSQVIDLSSSFAASPIVASSKFTSLYDFFQAIASKSLFPKVTLIQKLFSVAQKESIASISKTIASIISPASLAENIPFVNSIFDIASSEKEDILRRQIALNVLGEVGKETNLCDKGNILVEVQKIVHNKANSDVIRTAASIALGGIAIGNLDKVLPQVISAINNVSDGQYLMLNSLKQIIEHSSQLTQNLLDIIPNLFKATETSDESLCNIVSSIIGRVTLLRTHEMKSIILANLQSKNSNTKFTAVSSYKYFCQKTLKIDNDTKELVSALLSCLSVTDIRIRTAVLKSLNIIAFNIPSAIIHHVNKEEFFVPLRDALRFSQVREIDFGPFKQKNDDGEPVRNAAFSLLDTTIDHLHYRGAENFEREILEEALFEFANESSEDIKILRFQILTKFANKIPLKVTPYLDQISEVFLNVLKPYASKNDGDRAADMVRIGLLSCLALKSVAEDEQNVKYLNFWDLVMKTEKFRNIISTLTN